MLARLIPDSPATLTKQHAALRVVLAAIVVGAAVYITYIATTARIEQYDGYVYLNNAKRMLDLPPARFEHIRPPLISLAMLPAVRLAASGAAANAGYFIWPHLTAVVLSLLSALAIGLLLRRHWGTTLALVGITFFVTSRLFIRYGPFVMADLLSAGLVASVLAVYLRTWTDGEKLPEWHTTAYADCCSEPRCWPNSHSASSCRPLRSRRSCMSSTSRGGNVAVCLDSR